LKTGLTQAKVQGFAEVLIAKDAEDGISALCVIITIETYDLLCFFLSIEFKLKAWVVSDRIQYCCVGQYNGKKIMIVIPPMHLFV
jgi:hypothetical protein